MAVKKSDSTEPETVGVEATAENTAEVQSTVTDAVNSVTDAPEQTAGVTDTVAQENAAQTATDAPKQFVYIGPSVPRGKLMKNAIFTGTREEIEKYLADVLEKYPKIKNLIVPVEELAESREKVSKPGNAINRYYVELASEFKA
jgi:hypothetical protein